MDMTFIGGDGYLPAYTRTKLTNRLHGSSGFRTDYQITTSFASTPVGYWRLRRVRS